MYEVVDFWFELNTQLWSLVISNWILSLSVLIIVINWIISLVNNSRQD